MRLGLLLALLAGLVAGCAHSRSAEERAGGFILPEVPPFLSGPMGVLLTNTGGFSCEATLTTGLTTTSQQPEVLAGKLLARNDWLLFAPDPGSLDKRLRSLGLSFIWNVSENHGFMLSESLQGFAPVGFTVHYTNVVSTRTGLVPERVEGHSCMQEEVLVASTEGAATRVQVWRATDLNGLPVRLIGGVKLAPQTLTLARIRRQAPAPELFQPPPSFTRYDSAEQMMTEATLRQHSLKRSPTAEFNEQEVTPGSPYQRPR